MKSFPASFTMNNAVHHYHHHLLLVPLVLLVLLAMLLLLFSVVDENQATKSLNQARIFPNLMNGWSGLLMGEQGKSGCVVVRR